MIFTQVLLRWYGGTGEVVVTGHKGGVETLPRSGASVVQEQPGPFPMLIEVTAPGAEIDMDHAVIEAVDITAAGNQVVFLKPDGTEETVDLVIGTNTYSVSFGGSNIGGLIAWGGFVVFVLGGLFLVTRK